MKKPKIYEVIKLTSGGFHSWVNSSVGVIRKENRNINIFKTVVKPTAVNSNKLSWYQALWNWLKKVFYEKI